MPCRHLFRGSFSVFSFSKKQEHGKKLVYILGFAVGTNLQIQMFVLNVLNAVSFKPNSFKKQIAKQAGIVSSFKHTRCSLDDANDKDVRYISHRLLIFCVMELPRVWRNVEECGVSVSRVCHKLFLYHFAFH